MSFLGKLMSSGVGEIVGAVGQVIDAVHTSDEEKVELKLKVEAAVTQRMAVIEQSIQARFKMVSNVIESEMRSGDNFTKRARPSLVYFGMIVIFLNYLLFPWISHFGGAAPPSIELPEEFWYAWTGVVGLWVVGRSAEKSGTHNKATRAITGSEPTRSSALSFLN